MKIRALWLAILFLAGCSDDNRLQRAQQLASAAGMQQEQIQTGPFVLTAWEKITQPDRPMHVYIEGDGFAWVTRNQPSQDPTPKKAIGLQLAAADPSPNVVYLARPCQFTPPQLNSACQPDYWLGKRFAPEVITAMNRALDQVSLRMTGEKHIELTGYSGGGAVATLLAAQRHDIVSLRTVAGNLDQAMVNQLHQVSPMPGSLNAIDIATKVADLPQIHFSGGDDSVVPIAVTRHFVSVSGGRCAQVVSVPGLTHGGNWGEIWPSLLAKKPECLR